MSEPRAIISAVHDGELKWVWMVGNAKFLVAQKNGATFFRMKHALAFMENQKKIFPDRVYTLEVVDD